MRGYLLSRMPVEKAQSQKYTTGKLHRIKSDQLFHNRGDREKTNFRFPRPQGAEETLWRGRIPCSLRGRPVGPAQRPG